MVLDVFAHCGIHIVDSAVSAGGFVLAEEDLFEAGVVYDLQFAGFVLGEVRTKCLVKRCRADVAICF